MIILLFFMWILLCGRFSFDAGMLQVCIVGILVSVLNQVLIRSGRDEMATMTTLVALVVVLMIVVKEISGLFDLVKELFDL